MERPKFIITDGGRLRLGMVHMHRDLLQPGESCWGGGYYEFDFAGGRLVLHGESYDYGRPRWDRLVVLKVSGMYEGLRIVYRMQDPSDGELDIGGMMRVEYC